MHALYSLAFQLCSGCFMHLVHLEPIDICSFSQIIMDKTSGSSKVSMGFSENKFVNFWGTMNQVWCGLNWLIVLFWIGSGFGSAPVNEEDDALDGQTQTQILTTAQRKKKKRNATLASLETIMAKPGSTEQRDYLFEQSCAEFDEGGFNGILSLDKEI